MTHSYRARSRQLVMATTSLQAELRRGALLGAPLGYALGLLIYGGIGYLVAGQSGLLVGCLIATAFAALGLHLILRYIKAAF